MARTTVFGAVARILVVILWITVLFQTLGASSTAGRKLLSWDGETPGRVPKPDSPPGSH
ncbi:OLC1v1032427C1 [Oldenlandia corymbosa var. corymbosa]|uniref:OLC1v1032427C1 n=1 Tax=Oldenlandia corymbosa var. corymbosa TaxID=529605 RepID=A0AAV1CLL7_OLDCO|nr:OLC1v1032427C1 [Oldenlandia corymbosa var. corymbosa]